MTLRHCRQAALASTALLLGVLVADAAPKPTKPVPLPRPKPVAASQKAAPVAVSAKAVPAAPTPKAKPAPAKPAVPLAVAATTSTGADDFSAVRRAMDLVKKDKMSDAADVARSVSDPVARKLIEWAILRGEDDEFNFERYASFIAANPGWPHITMFRRKAEKLIMDTALKELKRRVESLPAG